MNDDFMNWVCPGEGQAISEKGGKGSGNFGHAGRPGKTGGSSKQFSSNKMGTISDFKKMVANPDELVNFIRSLINDDFSGSIGLRGLYKDEKTENMRNSRMWDDGKPQEELSGTSAINIGDSYDPFSIWKTNIKRNANRVFLYGDGNIGLIIGDPGNAGEDIGEIIIPNAKMIYMWKDEKTT